MPRTYKPTGKPRGRPKGSLNKPKSVAEFIVRATQGTLIPPVEAKPPRKNRKATDPIPDLERHERAKRAAAARTPESFKNVGRRKGVPNHTHAAKYQATRAALRPEITRIVKIMKNNGELPEDTNVAAAVAALLEVIAGEEKAADRIGAARTILDHFHAKPTSKQEVTVKSPADFLRELAAEDDNTE